MSVVLVCFRGVETIGGAICLGSIGGGRPGEGCGTNLHTGTHKTCCHNLLVCQGLIVKCFVCWV